MRGNIAVALLLCWITLLVAFSSIASAQPAQNLDRTQPFPAVSTATIRGRVSDTDGIPIRRAEVRAFEPDIGENRFATSDGDGRFEVHNLVPGRWILSAMKANFVPAEYGQQRAFEPGKPISLSAGSTTTANFVLTRGAVISGHVYDEFGDPLGGIGLRVLRSQMVRGNRRLTARSGYGQAVTDDTGSFRIFGLNAGDYYVGAFVRVGSPMTYAPGTISPSDAQRITIRAGDQVYVNISLEPTRGFRVAGTVLDADGNPAEGAALGLADASDASALPLTLAVSATDAQGAFSIPDLPKGSYVLTARLQRQSEALQQAFVPMTVSDGDIAGVIASMSRGVTVDGLVVSDGQSVLPEFTGTEVVASSTRGDVVTHVEHNGAFHLTDVFGSVVLRLRSLPETWMMKSVEVNGRTVTDQPQAVSDITQSSAIRIVLTDKTTQVTGSVMSSGGSLGHARIVVFAADPSKWAYPSRFVRSTTMDAQARFDIRAMPPDPQYLVVALDAFDAGDAEDPEFLEHMRSRATTFSLQEGEHQTINLTLTGR